MRYNGKYEFFDVDKIKAYPLSTRSNKVTLDDLVEPAEVRKLSFDLPEVTVKKIQKLAEEVVSAKRGGRPVIFFTGAHLIKNGLSPLLVDLVNRGVVTCVAGNGATAIHDFELALVGQTSEDVPNALGQGQFGMAYEFAYTNIALSLGDELDLGYGESLGKMICDEDFRGKVLATAARGDSPREFAHPEISILAACYKKDIPMTIHVGIGTDVIDQHASFDGRAKGGCSGRDFLIFANEITKLVDGGVILNVGSAVTGPEVLLKAVSMAANVGLAPDKIITADFDLRGHEASEMVDESSQCYYFRDQKSVVTRIPQAFGGQGFYVQGNQIETVPLLYQKIIENL